VKRRAKPDITDAPTVSFPGDVPQTRRRSTVALFATVALMNGAMAAAIPASTITAANQLGVAWSGVPSTAGIVGTGVGAIMSTRAAQRWGLRTSFALGYAAAAFGGLLAVAGTNSGSPAIVSVGMLLLGLGNASALLSRYAAADLYPASRRGMVIGSVVWASTAGAVGAPQLLAPGARLAARFGWLPESGALFFAMLASAAAGILVLAMATGRPNYVATKVPLRNVFRTRTARSALAVMATGQVVMVAIMTATPVDMHSHNQQLGTVGLVLSAHTLGMFALSPATGWLLDRVGARPIMFAGLLALAMSATAVAAAPVGNVWYRTGALFLLGYGWNLCFVGGSGRLSKGLPEHERRQREGAVDAAVWGVAAIGSMLSTVVTSTSGYPLLAEGAGFLVLVPAVMLIRQAQVPSSRTSHPESRESP